MYLFVVALHMLLCVFLILIIILQPGKGGDVGAAFGGGGGGSQMFGPRGPAGLLQRATTGVAVMFMCTSITLAKYSNPKGSGATEELDTIERLERQAEEAASKDGAPEDAVESEE